MMGVMVLQLILFHINKLLLHRFASMYASMLLQLIGAILDAMVIFTAHIMPMRLYDEILKWSVFYIEFISVLSCIERGNDMHLLSRWAVSFLSKKAPNASRNTSISSTSIRPP